LATVFDTPQRDLPLAPQLPLLVAGDGDRTVAWRHGAPISARDFLADVQHVADHLPPASAAVNLCEDRYAFLVAFSAIALRGQTNLLPSSRAPRAIDEVMAAHPGCYALGDLALEPAPPHYHRLPSLDVRPAAIGAIDWPMIDADQVVALGYTSGSTGQPAAHVKTWRSFHASNAGNLRMLRGYVDGPCNVVATVPPQHMYGMETSVVLPLLGDVAVCGSRPFFPADVAAALAAVPAPRVLVTTPVHQQRYGAPLLEVFGSTETCVFASRQPTASELWQLYEGVSLHPQPDGTQVQAPQLAAPVVLADLVTLHDAGRAFRLCGRHADMLEIAGKRASLGDLTRRLLAIPGVRDGAVVQLDEPDARGVRRIAALAVAPGLGEAQILEALRGAIDPLFLPRPLRLVNALPRNETGKLPRAALLALLAARD